METDEEPMDFLCVALAAETFFVSEHNKDFSEINIIWNNA